MRLKGEYESIYTYQRKDCRMPVKQGHTKATLDYAVKAAEA